MLLPNDIWKRGPICNMHIRYHSYPNPSVCGVYLVNVEDVGFLEVLPVSRGDNQWLLGAAGGGDDVIIVGEVHDLFDNVGENLQGGVPMGNLLMGDKLGLLSFFYFLLQIFSCQFPGFFSFFKGASGIQCFKSSLPSSKHYFLLLLTLSANLPLC